MMSKDKTTEETKPEAIKLAEWAEWFLRNVREPLDFRWTQMAAMAVELRRLSEENQRLRSAQVPDGCKLVPLEPTDEMMQAFKRRYKEGDFWRERITGAVCAMLAAAPQPPVAKQSQQVEMLGETCIDGGK